MNNLALAQSLFGRIWLPRQALEFGQPSPLIGGVAPIIDESAELKKQPVQPPVGVKDQKKSEPTSQPQIQSGPATLAVQAPTAFHIAATMVAPRWGLIAHVPAHQAGLAGDEYLMLSRLVTAFRQYLGSTPSVVEFDFFRWPPRRGVAKGLDVNTMGLSALKGFLHKMALQQQCSWLVLDELFARFCFQRPDITALTVLPRGQQQLVIGPSLAQLQADSQLKKALWLSLKATIDGQKE